MSDSAEDDPAVLTVGWDNGGGLGTALVLVPRPGSLPRIAWLGPLVDGLDPTGIAVTVGMAQAAPSVHLSSGRSSSILPEVSADWFGQPGLRGHRSDPEASGRDWSTEFRAERIDQSPQRITVSGLDTERGLALRTEFESLAGGPIRVRHTITNLIDPPYLVDGLDVMMPVPDRVSEVLDLTGRWGRERSPQRHPVVDGVFLREGRTGKPGPESATVLSVGTTGFGFGHGEVWGTHLGWSGNSRHFVERLPSGQTVLGAGELLLPGEITLMKQGSYSTPWVYFAAAGDGLDALAAQFHDYLRSLSAHPTEPKPVVCNVWEAVYFDHDLSRLISLAEHAAAIGVERFVLDDGWFGARRDDHAGLGDWVVSDQAWPSGLDPLVSRVRGLGLEFGLWFEPEMVNRDSELFRRHPEWVLAVPGRDLREFRNQLVLDLGRPEVRHYLFDQIDAVLTRYPIDFVKWDHNRSLGDGAGRTGSAGVHAQTLGFYDLLDRLRSAHPSVQWESCASGGARIDLEVLQRCERVWTSDMTDALSRQLIQRWTGQLVAPEYLGAHISAPTNHQTGRQLSLDFRAATAFFGDLGIEWDITRASQDERDRLTDWIALYKRHRPLLHGGRMVRADPADPAYWLHGVRSHDRGEAIFAYVQMDETVREPVPFQVPGLDPLRRYRASRISPPPVGAPSPDWRGEGVELTGAVLAAIGLPPPVRWPESVLLVHLRAL